MGLGHFGNEVSGKVRDILNESDYKVREYTVTHKLKFNAIKN